MEIFVKKSIPFFFVTILLLICSSYEFPNLGRGGSLLWKLDLRNPPKREVDPVIDPNHPLNMHDYYSPLYKPSPIGDPPPSTMVGNEIFVRDRQQTPEQETGIALKLFGRNGAKNFRTGWKVGKKIYSVLDKCEKYKDYFTCPLPSFNCSSMPSESESESESESTLYCILELVENPLNSTCRENCGVPPETPCSYVDGALALSSGCPLMISTISPANSPAYIFAYPPADYTPPLPADTVPSTTNYGNRIMVLDLYQFLLVIMIPYIFPYYL